jgi:hypothetical protein
VVEIVQPRTASCHVGYTGTHLITEVNQRWARLVLGWVTALIAYSATGRANPSTSEARATGGEEKLIKESIGYTTTHRTELEHLNKDVKTDGLDGVAKKVNS